jgi:hypothetical protein
MRRNTVKRKAKRTARKPHPDVRWVIGLVAGDRRAKSYEVAHAMQGKHLVCGRAKKVKWNGYRRARIVKFVKPAPYETKCKRCLGILHPTPGRRKR